MITIEKINGCRGAKVDVKGTAEDIYLECKTLIDLAYTNTEFGELFISAWDSIIKEKEEKND